MRTALLTLTLISCVQDVDIGLNDGGTNNNNDTGTNADTGTAADSGTQTDPDASIDVDTGVTCTGDTQECVACGHRYPPICVNNQWVCQPVPCIPCNVDSECEAN